MSNAKTAILDTINAMITTAVKAVCFLALLSLELMLYAIQGLYEVGAVFGAWDEDSFPLVSESWHLVDIYNRIFIRFKSL